VYVLKITAEKEMKRGEGVSRISAQIKTDKK
jgi:hypothetical protein